MNETLTKGCAYTHWVLDVGKGRGLVHENVRIVCAESSQRYMSREEAISEAQRRIKVKIEKSVGRDNRSIGTLKCRRTRNEPMTSY